MKKVKRAIALSGGGPPVGIQVGALKALEENDIHFDVFTTDCIGSWTASIYNSHDPGERFKKLHEFYKICFVPDEVFDGFSVPINIFVNDYYEDSLTALMKFFDLSSYENLWLPQQIFKTATSYLDPKNYPKNTVDWSLFWTKMISLTPLYRFMFKINYQSHKTGQSWLLGPKDFGADLVSQYIDFEGLKKIDPLIYINAYNLDTNQIDLFINRNGDKDNPNHYKPISLDALKANSSILGYLRNRKIDGQAYCEGAVVDTVNFRSLIENHPDLEEVWVINILDYKLIKPPQNQLEADLLAVEVPFTTIAQDDIKLFAYHLKEEGLEDKIKLIKINASYKDLNYYWRWSNLEKGIAEGYAGAQEAVRIYREQSKTKKKKIEDVA